MPSTGNLDLSSVPPIFILPTHLSTDELHEYEDHVYAADGALTYNPVEARVFIGRVVQKKRAAFDLRAKGIWTEQAGMQLTTSTEDDTNVAEARGEKRKLPEGRSDSSSTASERSSSPPAAPTWRDLRDHILVIKLDWLDACLKQRRQLPYQGHLVYRGKIVNRPQSEEIPSPIKDTGVVTYIKATPGPSSSAAHKPQPGPPAPRPFGHPRTSPSMLKRSPPKLHRTTTSEFEGRDSSRGSSPSKLPPLPDWAKAETTHSYACCRTTLLTSPNDAFLSELQKIKLARILTLDAIGVRAYSTSIAAIAAYPYLISSETEIIRLPGCNNRIAELWREWYDSPDHSIAHVRQLADDPDLTVLRLFYEIWGVGADTARKLYYTHNLRDLDDVVEYHWSSLTRVQQIGVKFYTEFQQPIPRDEVAAIADTIHQHARACKAIPQSAWDTEEDMVCVIVGGYRRGKLASGDVDVILSHRDERVTRDLVVDVVRSLENEGWITHTLTLQTTTSDRDQQTLPFRGEGHGGHGFDSLDKALCVWQDPRFEGEGKNSNVHRRVDIILSPWRTVGCAVLGWSGGTTFQRDLRRYANKMRGWKFDSSGVRDRGSGVVVDLEGEGGTWEERERKVMEGLGLGYRPPGERCTG